MSLADLARLHRIYCIIMPPNKWNVGTFANQSVEAQDILDMLAGEDDEEKKSDSKSNDFLHPVGNAIAKLTGQTLCRTRWEKNPSCV